MVQRQPWDNDPIVGGVQRSGGGYRRGVTQVVPPSPAPASAARPDQARGEAASATQTEYHNRTDPRRDAANDARANNADRRADDQQRFTQMETVLQNFHQDPSVRGFNAARESFIGLRNLQRNPDAANAMATIYTFMKTLDPTSTVREGEAASVQNAAGIPDQIRNAYNAALSGDGLNPDQRQQIVRAARVLLEARARTYNETAIRARTRLSDLGFPMSQIGPQLPISTARGAGGYEYRNQLYRAGGRPETPLDSEGRPMDIRGDQDAIREGRGAINNAVTPDQGYNQTGIQQGTLPEGQHVEFAMDELDPSRVIGHMTGTPADAAHDMQFTDHDLAAMESWLRANGQNATPQQFDEFIASLPPNPNWQGPHRISNSGALLEQWQRRGVMFEGQNRVPGPDLSARIANQGTLGEGIDAGVRGAADTATLGLSDEISAGLDTMFHGGTYADNLRQERGVDSYDEQNNAIPRAVGQFAGGLALPSGVGEAGQAAARAAIRSGLGRTEAVQLARQAMARRLGRESAIYGGAYGAGSGEGDLLDRVAHAGVDAAFGELTGRALPSIGAFDRAGSDARAARRAAQQPPVERPPLVDPETGRLNQPLEAASPAERVGAARDFGIDLPLDAATDRGGRIIARGFDNLPGSAGVMNDARREVGGQVAVASEGVASGYGNARGMYEQGQATQRGAQDWLRRATGESGTANRGVVGRAYDRIAIPDTYPSELGNTRQALAEMTDVMRTNPKLRQRFQNSRLMEYLDALTPNHSAANELGDIDPMAGILRTMQRGTTQEGGQLGWRDLNHFRSIIGEEIGEARFSDSPLKSQLRRLYGALSEDMRATAAAHGPDSLRNFERANGLYHSVENRLENDLVGILGDDARQNPERAAEAVNRLIRSGRGSANIRQLANVRASTIKNGNWDETAGAIVRQMGQPAGSEGRGFDPGVFVRNYADSTPEARNLLFGSIRNGRGETRPLRDALDRFVAVNQRLAESNALRNTSNTVPAGIGAGVVGSAGAGVAAGFINPLLAVKLAAGGAASAYAVNRLSRLWTDPKFVQWATGYSSMLARAARTGEAPSAEAITGQRQYLARVARSSPAIAAEIGQFADRLFPHTNSDGTREPE